MNDINFKSEVKLATTVLKPHAMRLTSNIYDAEDLIQETIVRALVNEDKFQEGTNIKAWLFTIMKNILLMIIEKNQSEIQSLIPQRIYII